MPASLIYLTAPVPPNAALRYLRDAMHAYCARCRTHTQTGRGPMMRARDGSHYMRAKCLHCGGHKALRGRGWFDTLKGIAQAALPIAKTLIPLAKPYIAQRSPGAANILGALGMGLRRRRVAPRRMGGSFSMAGGVRRVAHRRRSGGRLASGYGMRRRGRGPFGSILGSMLPW